jgi:hypothetical protein
LPGAGPDPARCRPTATRRSPEDPGRDGPDREPSRESPPEPHRHQGLTDPRPPFLDLLLDNPSRELYW